MAKQPARRASRKKSRRGKPARSEPTKPARRERALAPRSEPTRPRRRDRALAPRSEPTRPRRRDRALAPRSEPTRPRRRDRALAPRSEPTRPRRRDRALARRAKAKPGTEALAREIVAAWRRGETPSLEAAEGRLPSLVDEVKRMSARSRQALYRAVNRLVRAPATRDALAEAELSALVVRAIELETFVEVAAGDGSALAAFIGE